MPFENLKWFDFNLSGIATVKHHFVIHVMLDPRRRQKEVFTKALISIVVLDVDT